MSADAHDDHGSSSDDSSSSNARQLVRLVLLVFAALLAVWMGKGIVKEKLAEKEERDRQSQAKREELLEAFRNSGNVRKCTWSHRDIPIPKFGKTIPNLRKTGSQVWRATFLGEKRNVSGEDSCGGVLVTFPNGQTKCGIPGKDLGVGYVPDRMEVHFQPAQSDNPWTVRVFNCWDNY